MLPAAYYVFSNEVMGQIVAAKPTNVKDLLRVKGKKEKMVEEKEKEEEEEGRRRRRRIRLGGEAKEDEVVKKQQTISNR